MARLHNTRHERFARLIAKGLPISIAYGRAGYTGQRSNASTCYSGNTIASHKIRQRVSELLMEAKDLSQDDILNRVMGVADLAESSGQCSAALKGWEMIGKQLHKMFGDRREQVNINLGNMDQQTLYKFLHDRYGNRAQELITWLNNHYNIEAENSVDSRVATRTNPPRLTIVPSPHDDDGD